MTDVTVKQFAEVVGVPSDRLLAQLVEAGMEIGILEAADYEAQTRQGSWDIGADELVGLVMEAGEVAVQVMALLDEANTTRFGHPEITACPTSLQDAPGILVSGHDMVDLDNISHRAVFGDHGHVDAAQDPVVSVPVLLGAVAGKLNSVTFRIMVEGLAVTGNVHHCGRFVLISIALPFLIPVIRSKNIDYLSFG